MSFVASDAVLVGVQAALVLVPGRPRRIASSRLLGSTIPAAALIVGVGIGRGAAGADFLAALASIATPVLAAVAGKARGWRYPWVPVAFVPPLYLLAWLEPRALAGQAAAVALIAAACLAITGFVAAIAPRNWLIVGLLLLVALDVVLVWGDPQVAPTVQSLQHASTPVLGRPLPALQQVEFGSALMGWLDMAAPALLGLVVARRAAAAIAVGVSAGAWALLLLVTPTIAATPPVIAGVITGSRSRRRFVR